MNAHDVRYVIIGAAAFPVHGYARATLDVDIFIAADEENARRTWEALRDFGYDATDLSIAALRTKKILIRQYLVETDVHPFVAGLTFEEAWAGRVEGQLGETKAWFAGLDDLIQMKESAGRPKDREDLRVLRMLRRRRVP